MAQFIIHKNGAYNIYGTIADAPYFDEAMNIEQLQEFIRENFGACGLAQLPERLERAHATGCSSNAGWTLDECISGNRAGADEAEVPIQAFVEKYLTLKTVGASIPPTPTN